MRGSNTDFTQSVTRRMRAERATSVCQVIHKVREASPEVRSHLAVAASSLLQAAAAVLEARAGKTPAPDSQVTKIDLDDA